MSSRFVLSGSVSLAVNGQPFALFTADHLLELRVRHDKLVLFERVSGEAIAQWNLDQEGNPIDASVK